ncbi:hypothetical protein HHK36_005725 [Tetracentron sinense]|uniref:IQ-domain 33 n=1 Tax=Tetracentron sinense TaxID=13715 RepID=A0A834ZNU6_TETSI|nr:hypothetical protein HHK36_005725 [Tetracentron sinense]
MGLTGELVRTVFSKSRSLRTHESNVRISGVDKRRWSSVRSYLCGDEFNSVLAEDNSASVRSSEATVTQPMLEELRDQVEIQGKEKEEQIPEQNQNSSTKLLSEEDAAIVIQSAFRGSLARRNEGTKQMGDGKTVKGTESPSGESVGTSIEVQTGNSMEVLTVSEESVALQHRVQHKAPTQASKLKEDWDDSTVSSNISKLRIQNRMEATTRRERALAYAFSQQLRICSKRKSTQSDTTEANMGWSWLERWMATRLPESSLVEAHMSKPLKPTTSDRRPMIIKKKFDVAGEEKEICGSNEVYVGIKSFTVTAETVKDSYKPAKNRLRSKSMSERKSEPSYQYPTNSTKVSKNNCSKEADRKNNQMQAQNNGEIKCKDVSSQPPTVSPTSNNSKLGL